MMHNILLLFAVIAGCLLFPTPQWPDKRRSHLQLKRSEQRYCRAVATQPLLSARTAAPNCRRNMTYRCRSGRTTLCPFVGLHRTAKSRRGQ